jgi:hypothetical protein
LGKDFFFLGSFFFCAMEVSLGLAVIAAVRALRPGMLSVVLSF